MNRRAWPGAWRRFAIWLLLTFAGNYVHARIRPFILTRLPSEFLRDIYLRITSGFFLTCTLVSGGGLVVCYYFALRERRVHTALTEFGLAARSIVAALLVLIAFVLALEVNGLT
ncbi:MAG: hypothetical protein JO231_06515 [Acidobacteria bacterium]|nr:hypothetical protein [Acidobacteriota bacterium]